MQTAADLHRFIEDYNTALETGRMQMLKQACGKHLLLAFLDAHFQDAYKHHEGYLILYVAALLMDSQLLRANQLARSLYKAGVRQGLLIELMVICLAEAGRPGEALKLMADNAEAEKRNPNLVKRRAALSYITGDFEAANRHAATIRSWVSDKLMAEVQASEATSQARLQKGEAARLEDHDGLTNPYESEEFQTASWQEYSQELFENPSPFRSSILYFEKILGEFLEETFHEAPDLNCFVNYGSLFGYLEYSLARRFPAKKWLGYDLSPVAKQLNDRIFDAPNLTYLAGDFRDAVTPLIDGGKTVVCHIRTGTLMFPEELERFYGQCADMGIARLLVVEDANFNLSTATWPDFSRSNHKTGVLGGVLMHHDYPWYLEQAGYKVVRTHKRNYPFLFGETINADAMVTEVYEAVLAT